MRANDIREELLKLRDDEYCSFQSKLIPNVPREYFIGVRTPELRKLAAKLAKTADGDEFLEQLPHATFDENQLHAFITALEKDFDKCIEKTERFLPYIDNWATCDQFSPKVFAKNKDRLIPYIEKWMASDRTYTVRFSIGLCMQHFLGDDFSPKFPEMIAELRSDEYYVRMEIAWYFATALAKQYDDVIPYIENRQLDDWTHNKTIQKSVESLRITSAQKNYLKSLRISRRS